MDFSQCTGKGIRVGIIDSGVDLFHPDIRKVCGGISITVVDKEISCSEDFADCIGHGTACAGIIQSIALDVELYIVKIFEQILRADEKALAAAIKWMVDSKVKIINLSLCTVHKEYLRELKEACDYAFENRIVIVSAKTPLLPNSFPSDFPNVISVIPGKIYDTRKYFYLREEKKDFFVARGCLQKVAWINSGYALREGSSYAAPHISGIVAKICEAYPSADVFEVKKILIPNAAAELRDSKVDVVWTPIKRRYRRNKNSVTQISNFDSPTVSTVGKSWTTTVTEFLRRDAGEDFLIRKAALYPYREETQIFVKEHQLLNFKIVGVADTIDSGLVGRDAGEVLKEKPVGIKIIHSLQKAMKEADTLIIGHVDWLSNISGTDVLKQVTLKAIQCCKNVYSLAPPDFEWYEEINALAKEKGVSIAYPEVSWLSGNSESETAPEAVDVPIVAVFGTGIQQGKFLTQLVLKKKLSKEGYKVGQIGTDNRSALFGFDVCFPTDGISAMSLPIGTQIAYFQRNLLKLWKTANPDIIIAGAQSEVVPYDIHLPSMGTFPSISLLLGLKPDAYILVIDSIDTQQYIQDSVNVLQAIGKGKTIALVLNDRKMNRKPIVKSFEPQKECMTQAEMKEILLNLERKLKIPAVTIADESGRERLVNIVIDYFAY